MFLLFTRDLEVLRYTTYKVCRGRFANMPSRPDGDMEAGSRAPASASSAARGVVPAAGQTGDPESLDA